MDLNGLLNFDFQNYLEEKKKKRFVAHMAKKKCVGGVGVWVMGSDA